MATQPDPSHADQEIRLDTALTPQQRSAAEALLADASPDSVTWPIMARYLGRPTEIVVAGVGLALTSPLLAIAAVLIRLESPGPVLYRQPRVGLCGQRFTILKLRTMRVEPSRSNWELAETNVHAAQGDARMWKAFRDPRVTRTGALVRACAIDELPQLWNVARGEMAFVGPRPLSLDEDRWVVGQARQRRDVRPGMTGLWQVLGGNEITMAGMLWLDCAYARRRSTLVDLRLIARTPRALARGFDNWRRGGTG